MKELLLNISFLIAVFGGIWLLKWWSDKRGAKKEGVTVREYKKLVAQRIKDAVKASEEAEEQKRQAQKHATPRPRPVRASTRSGDGLGRSFVVILIVGGIGYGIWYFNTPHPHPRTVVQIGYESIVTVDGVSTDGWLTECDTGTVRHIAGDYSIVKDKTPVVCVGERNYQDWLKQQENQGRQ